MSDSEFPAGRVGAGDAADAVLSVRDLEKHFPVKTGLLRRETGRVRAVDGINFDLRGGEAFGLVGESGCGKSTAARTVLGLESKTGGEVYFDGQPVESFDAAERTQFRRRVAMVFQDPTSSFDPRLTIGESVAEPMIAHGLTDAGERDERVESLLEVVGLSTETGERYPHELSGGQKQRAALARALSLDPDVLLLDEPVSALDVSVQAAILALIDDLQSAFDLSILLISHDMSVVRQVCDRIGVMYAGELVERGPSERLFEEPRHPYTRVLLASVFDPDRRDWTDVPDLRGQVPDPAAFPDGCRFHPRCPEVIPTADLNLPEDTWRSVFELRVDLREDRFDRTLLDDEHADGTPVPDRVRAEYALSADLQDETAERALTDALDALDERDREGARERLAETFTSVCVDERPQQYDIDGRTVACHRHVPADADDAPPAVEAVENESAASDGNALTDDG
jgi:peptide/nickel transport system ATP-binding protein